MVRKLAAALLGVGVMVPGLVQALGLGGIKLNSALSEPLDAEIELVQVRELTQEEILPALASNSDFSAAGVEKFHFLTEMKFDVVVNPNGRSYIKVTSRKPMKEPFVNFLVEVHWPDGRLLREYTMLLDPPVYRAQAAPAIQRSTVSAPKTAARASAPPAARPAPVSSQPVAAVSSAAVSAPAPTGSGDTYGPTGPSDSLWGIASQLRPSSSVNVQQTMLAIQRLNPQAFVNGNINLLKRGQVLRTPSEEDARAISSQDAIRMVAEQNRAWRDKTPTPSTAQAAPVDATGNSAGMVPARVDAEEGKLSLVAPAKTETVAGETAQGGEASGTGGVLRDKLAMAEENTDKFKLENEDLKLKLNDLQQQTDTTNQVLKLKDDQIAELQAKMAALQAQLEQAKAGAAANASVVATDQAGTPPDAAQGAAAESAAASTDVAATAASPTDAPATTAVTEDSTKPEVDYNYEAAPETPVAAEPAKTESPATTELPEKTEPAAEAAAPVASSGVVGDITKPSLVETPKPKPVQATPEAPSLVDEILSNWLYLLGIAGLGAAGLIGASLSRRKKDESSDIEESFVRDFSLPGQSSEAIEDIQDKTAAAQEEKTPSQKEEAVAQTADVVGEADIYIAYGRFTQAAEMLEKAAAKEPGREDIRLKLLEVAVESKNTELFDRHAAIVAQGGNAASQSRMESLRHRLAAATVVAAPAAPAAPAALQAEEPIEEEDAFASLEFDAGSIDFDKTVESRAPTQPVSGLDFSLDFKLTDTPVEAKPVVAKAPATDDNSLDFDLEMDLEKDFAPVADSKPASAPAAPKDDIEALEFEGDFRFEPDAPLAADDDHEIEIELVTDEADVATVDEDAPLDFELVDDIESPSAPVSLAEDDDVRHAMDFEKEDTIDSSSAAMLADELDFEEPSTELAEEADSFVLDEVAEIAPAAPVAPAPVAFKQPEPADSEEDLDFITDGDEASTKLDLARAYIDMGDREGARDILDEVLNDGNADQQREARELLSRLE